MAPIRFQCGPIPPPHFIEDLGLAAEEQKMVLTLKTTLRDLHASYFEFAA